MFDFRHGLYFFRHRVQTDSGAHPASYQMGTESYFPGGKVDHSPPASTEVKNMQIYTSILKYVFNA
jgi:hypothetical protein